MTMAQQSCQRRRRRRRRIGTSSSLWNAAAHRAIILLLLGVTVLFTTIPHVVTAQQGGGGGKPCFSAMGRTTPDGDTFVSPNQTCVCADGNWIRCYQNTDDDGDADADADAGTAGTIDDEGACYYESTFTSDGDSYVGPTQTCVCANGSWINCYKNTYDDDDTTALEEDAALEEEERDEDLLGNTVDENDCPSSAGYIWCPSLYQCYRPWEKTCEEIFAVCAGDESFGNCSCMANDFNVEASLVYKYCPELTSCIKGGCPKVYEDDDTSNSNEDIDDDLIFRDTETPTAAPKVISLTALPTLQPVDDAGAITDAPTFIDLTETPTYYPTTLAPIRPEDPTFAPTVFIETLAPTTREPTPRPTSRPSQQPNPLPTTLPPTPEPTKEPTPEPTPEPTEDPTPEPTPEPTTNPTRRPTPRPSRSPTPRPSSRPTPRPSPRPSKPPVTPDPTPSGTLSPTESPQPSFPPTRTFTDAPTLVPTAIPTWLLQVQTVPQAQMRLYPFPNAQTLYGNDAAVWIAETEAAIERHLETITYPAALDDPSVTVTIREQVNDAEYGLGGRTRRQRGLQDTTTTSSLYVMYTVDMLYRSAASPQEYNPDELVYDAFDSRIDRANYMVALQDQSSTFDAIDLVQVTIPGYDPASPTQAPNSGGGTAPVNPDEQKESVDIAIIVGAVIGGVALIILIVLLVVRLRNNQQTQKNNATTTDPGKDTNTTAAASVKNLFGMDVEKAENTSGTPLSSVLQQQTQAVKVSAEIVVTREDDISTLGDPIGLGGMYMGGIHKDDHTHEHTATISHDYDYMKAYHNYTTNPVSIAGGGITANTTPRDRTISADTGVSSTNMSSIRSGSYNKLGKMGENLFAEDASFEDQFVDPDGGETKFSIVAPPGKLGMVIDTPPGGRRGGATVHAIKQTSVLFGQVRVGDRLLTVDGEDCTTLNAIQVSKLISLKSEKPARVLVMARSSTAAAGGTEHGTH